MNKLVSKRLVSKQLCIETTGNMFYGCLAHFVVIANYASLCAMKLDFNEKITVNGKITASFQINLFPKHFFERYKQPIRTLKNC